MDDSSFGMRRGQADPNGGVVAGDTIYALASGMAVSGVAVIRISGPQADPALSMLTNRALPPLRRAALRRLLAADGTLLDEAVVLRFPEGASFTGEATVELHCHGGRAVIGAVLHRLSGLDGLRLAEPGEFTRRAFENGRMDLTEIEGLGDLIAAETEAQRRQALRTYEGGLSHKIETWRDALIEAMTLIEITIDWADEDVPEDTSDEVEAIISSVLTGIGETIRAAEGAEKLRHGLEIALVGAPNSGKSSLINRLAGREAAITSARPGTTRDVIELRYDLDGLPVVWLDMAGIRADPADDVERTGVERAMARARAAELRIFLDAPDAGLGSLGDDLQREGDIVIGSKSDLSGAEGGVSAKTGAGVPALLAEVSGVLRTRIDESGLAVGEHQTEALHSAGELLLSQAGGPEEHAEHIRQAIRQLDRVLGRVDPESVLDQIFSRFCLGK